MSQEEKDYRVGLFVDGEVDLDAPEFRDWLFQQIVASTPVGFMWLWDDEEE